MVKGAPERRRAGAEEEPEEGHGLRGSRGWDTAMARPQPGRTLRPQPTSRWREIPGRAYRPFLLVVDVGHSIALR